MISLPRNGQQIITRPAPQNGVPCVVLQVTPCIADLVRRLASEHDGEVIATARALQRTLKSAGHDLNDLATHLEHGTAPPRPKPADPYVSPENAIHVEGKAVHWFRCVMQIEAAHMDDLDDWSRGFLASIRTRAHLTSKQLACLQEIVSNIAGRQVFVDGSFWKGRH
jgi:hypothetical protein